MANPDDAELRRLLTEARTIAVVGLSDKPERDSHDVARYLQGQGYRILPVNPALTHVLGETAYPSLGAVPVEIHVDIVDVFRRSDQVVPIAQEAVGRGVRALWMQLGVENAEAERIAREAGIAVVQDRCIKIEHHRLGVRIPRPGPTGTGGVA